MTDEIFHPLHTDLPVPEGFNNPFDYTPHPLCLRAVEELYSLYTADPKAAADEAEAILRKHHCYLRGRLLK